MSSERKCRECCSIEYLQNNTPFQRAYVWLLLAILLAIGLLLTVDTNHELSKTICLVILVPFSFLLIALIGIYNGVGCAVYIFNDEDGRFHRHMAPPPAELYVIEHHRILAGRDFSNNAIYMRSNGAILKVRLGGWFRKSDFVRGSTMWDVVSAWGGVVHVQYHDEGMSFSLFDDDDHLANIMLVMRDSLLLSDMLRRGIAFRDMNDFLIDEINRSKETLGRSAHGQAIREFLEWSKSKVVYSRQNLTFTFMEREWEFIVGKHSPRPKPEAQALAPAEEPVKVGE